MIHSVPLRNLLRAKNKNEREHSSRCSLVVADYNNIINSRKLLLGETDSIALYYMYARGTALLLDKET